METTTFEVYVRKNDSFGMTYHSLYQGNFATAEAARTFCQQNRNWQDRGTVLIIAEVKKEINLLDGPEHRFDAIQPADDEDF